ncbi:MAG: metallophosphoesterase family protein [Rubripirellula sp.]
MSRQLAIGDIHGCFTALETLVAFVGVSEDDTLITLGDYVNRGPDSCKVIDWLMDYDRNYRLMPLRGNHEIMMLDSRNSSDKHRRWLQVGGKATLKSYAVGGEGGPGEVSDIPNHHWEFLQDRLLPYYESDTHVFVHGNLYSDMDFADQPSYMLYWEKFGDPPLHASGKVMVCGHTSQKKGLPLSNGNAICIDTWACGGGWLTCLDAKSGQVWQANQERKTRKFFVDELPAK